MKRFIALALAAVLVMATSALAGNYRLPLDGNGKQAVQGHAPKSQVTRTLGTGGKAVFKNISSSDLASMKCTGRTIAGVATVVKARVGGYSTGLETDFYPSDTVEVWDPPAKVGFRAYSTATTIYINCTKQP